MEPYQQRVIDEKTELDDKLSRLRPFVGSDKFRSLPQDEQGRMSEQLKLMERYSEVLAARIGAFNK